MIKTETKKLKKRFAGEQTTPERINPVHKMSVRNKISFNTRAATGNQEAGAHFGPLGKGGTPPGRPCTLGAQQ